MSKPEVTFVNAVSVSGFLNGVVNLSLTQTRFVAVEGKVELHGEVAADLRFDLHCAMAIRDVLADIIDSNTRPKAAN